MPRTIPTYSCTAACAPDCSPAMRASSRSFAARHLGLSRLALACVRVARDLQFAQALFLQRVSLLDLLELTPGHGRRLSFPSLVLGLELCARASTAAACFFLPPNTLPRPVGASGSTNTGSGGAEIGVTAGVGSSRSARGNGGWLAKDRSVSRSTKSSTWSVAERMRVELVGRSPPVRRSVRRPRPDALPRAGASPLARPPSVRRLKLEMPPRPRARPARAARPPAPRPRERVPAPARPALAAWQPAGSDTAALRRNLVVSPFRRPSRSVDVRVAAVPLLSRFRQ